MKDDTHLRQLHQVYCSYAIPVDYTLPRSFAWEQFVARGWTEADLRLVLANLHRHAKQGATWAQNAMRFSRLIVELDHFEEHLGECRAKARVPKFDPGKASVLRGTNRPDKSEPSKPKTAEQVIRESDALKALLEFRDSL